MNDMLGQRENQYSVGSGWVLFRCSHSGRRSVHLELRLSTLICLARPGAACGLRRAALAVYHPLQNPCALGLGRADAEPHKGRCVGRSICQGLSEQQQLTMTRTTCQRDTGRH